MYYDFDATDSLSYANLYSIYAGNYTENKLYVVDLSKKFNSSYVVTDKNDINILGIDTLKVVNGTLVKVSSGKITQYYVGVSDIQKELFK